MEARYPNLVELGWRPFSAGQLWDDEDQRHIPVRVMAVHCGKLAVAGAGPERLIPPSLADADEDHPSVGDWLLAIARHSSLSASLLG